VASTLTSAGLNSAAGDEKGLEKERWQQREERQIPPTATFTLVSVVWQDVGRCIGKVLALGHRTAWSGDTSARSREMAVPDSAAKVTVSTAYTSKQDNRTLDKRDVSSPVVSRYFCLLCVI